MTKRTKFLLIFLIIPCVNVFSQQLSHQVLVPAASVVDNGSLNYSQTIGETAVEIISGSGFELTQGFQQPSIKIIPQSFPRGNGVDVYPNPAIDFINVKLHGDVSRKFRIDIININGSTVSSTSINFIGPFNYILRIDVDQLKKGFYIVRIVSDDELISRAFKIEKM